MAEGGGGIRTGPPTTGEPIRRSAFRSAFVPGAMGLGLDGRSWMKSGLQGRDAHATAGRVDEVLGPGLRRPGFC